jgi:hypothetical protein
MVLKFKEGRYRGRVIGQALTESGNTPCAELTFLVTHVLGPGGLTTLQNSSRRTIRLWLTEASKKATENALEQLGEVPERPSQLDPYARDAVFYFGCEVELECLHREYDGQRREDWSIARSTPRRLTDEQIAKLDAQFGRLKAEPQPATATTTSESADDESAPY